MSERSGWKRIRPPEQVCPENVYEYERRKMSRMQSVTLTELWLCCDFQEKFGNSNRDQLCRKWRPSRHHKINPLYQGYKDLIQSEKGDPQWMRVFRNMTSKDPHNTHCPHRQALKAGILISNKKTCNKTVWATTKRFELSDLIYWAHLSVQ